MATASYSTPAGNLSLTETAKGIEVTGPDGRVVLSNRMLAHLAKFSVAMLDVLHPDPDGEDDCDQLDGCGSPEEDIATATVGNGLDCASWPLGDSGGWENDSCEVDDVL